MGTPNKYKKEYCKVAEKVLADGESLSALCAEIGVVRSTLHEWRHNHLEFNHAIELGLLKAQRVWENIGRDGIVGNYDKFNASSWIFTMKNRFRDDYAEEKENKTASETLVEMLIDKLVD